MAALDDFVENFEILLDLAYKKEHAFPPAVYKKKTPSSGIHARNGEALYKLRQIEKQLGRLNGDMLSFFGVPNYYQQGNQRPNKEFLGKS